MAISSPEMMLVPASESAEDDTTGRLCLLTKVDVTETAATDLSTDTVLVTDTKILVKSAVPVGIQVCGPVGCRDGERRGRRTIVVMLGDVQPGGGWPVVELSGSNESLLWGLWVAVRLCCGEVQPASGVSVS
jgi:hypothetical protein